jgi:hypothetical protein
MPALKKNGGDSKRLPPPLIIREAASNAQPEDRALAWTTDPEALNRWPTSMRGNGTGPITTRLLADDGLPAAAKS